MTLSDNQQSKPHPPLVLWIIIWPNSLKLCINVSMWSLLAMYEIQ